VQILFSPLTFISLSFFGGIVLARYLPQGAERWLQFGTGALVFAFLALLFRRLREDQKTPPFLFKTSPIYFLLPFFFFFGAYFFQYNQPDADDPFNIIWFTDREYESVITGVISDAPDYRDTYTNLQLDVLEINRPDKKNPLIVHGKILVRVDAGEIYQYGDYVRVRGVLETPPENEEFSYKDYLALSGIHAYMRNAEATMLPEARGGHWAKAAIYDLKDRALENIYILFPDPEASLLAGILLGVETGLPKDLQEAFKDTGTTHIIAISGFNITIIAGLFVSLFGRLFGKKTGAILAVLGIAAYTLLVGADAAVVRAALMGGVGLLGRQLGRQQDGITSLLAVAVIMALINPYVLWDVGFQLSFAATAGLILYAEPLSNWFVRQASRITSEERAQQIAGPIGEYFLFTLAAQFATIPIMAYHFGRISLISFLANPFILPVQPAVMILGGIALIASLLILPLGKILAIFALPFTTYTIRMVEFFDRMPHGVIVLGDTKLILVILVYIAMLAWTLAGFPLKKISKPVYAVTLTLIVFQIWRMAFALPDGKLHITFLNVGSADAVLIQTPDGETLLINGGERISDLSAELGERLPPFQRELDWLIVASPQEEDLAALPRTLERFPPAQVLWSGNYEASYASRALDKYLSTNGIPVSLAEAGQSFDLGQGAILRIQAAGTRGSVLLIEWDSFRALLPIGMDFECLDESQNLGALSLLLLADSGYAPLNPSEWIDALEPQLLILSVAADDRNGLPHESTLEAVDGYPLLRTDLNGWLHISTDGKEMWVEREK
jgi:competence protein ComEC